MNYRHAYHAGNFADCVKHALQHHILAALRRKPAPFRVLDTHAGIGAYDLREERAERTGEWRAGIGRLEGIAEGPLAPWLSMVRSFGWPPLYPGSPALSQAMLREQDRLVLCELHPEDQEELRTRIGRDRRVAVHARDGWEAATALTPFPEKRGLLLLTCGTRYNVVRMLPPLTMPDAILSEALDILDQSVTAAVGAA